MLLYIITCLFLFQGKQVKEGRLRHRTILLKSFIRDSLLMMPVLGHESSKKHRTLLLLKNDDPETLPKYLAITSCYKTFY